MLSEMMIKNLLKGINFPELQERLLSDPRVIHALELATNIRDDFATIKAQNTEILRRLDATHGASDIAPASAELTTTKDE